MNNGLIIDVSPVETGDNGAKPRKTYATGFEDGFKQANDLSAGNPLTFSHIGAVFGEDYWIMLVSCLMDAGDAARAVAGAMQRLTKINEDKGKDLSEAKGDQ